MNTIKRLRMELRRYRFRDRRGRKLENCGPFKKLMELAEKRENWRAIMELPDTGAIIKLVDEIVEKSADRMVCKRNLITANTYLKKKIKREDWRATVELPDACDACAIIKLVDEMVEKIPHILCKPYLASAKAHLDKKISQLFPKKDRSQKTKRAVRPRSA